MLLIALIPGILWPPKPPVGRTGGQADTVGAQQAPATRDSALSPVATAHPPGRPTASAETVWVTTPLARLGFSSRGAQLVRAELLQYQSFAPGDANRSVQLIPDGRPLLGLALVVDK